MMNMNQGRFSPALVASLVGVVLTGTFVAVAGLDADIGHSLPLLAAAIAVFVLPGCAGAAFRASQAAAAQHRSEHITAMAVMRDVAPLEAESLPLATVRNLTQVQVERRQRESRNAAHGAQHRDRVLAS